MLVKLITWGAVGTVVCAGFDACRAFLSWRDRFFELFFFLAATGFWLAEAVDSAWAKASLRSRAFLEGMLADGGPWMGTPASLDWLQCRLICRFWKNVMVEIQSFAKIAHFKSKFRIFLQFKSIVLNLTRMNLRSILSKNCLLLFKQIFFADYAF